MLPGLEHNNTSIPAAPMRAFTLATRASYSLLANGGMDGSPSPAVEPAP